MRSSTVYNALPPSHDVNIHESTAGCCSRDGTDVTQAAGLSLLLLLLFSVHPSNHLVITTCAAVIDELDVTPTLPSAGR